MSGPATEWVHGAEASLHGPDTGANEPSKRTQEKNKPAGRKSLGCRESWADSCP